jgi:5-methylcytosine-specific restriction endonuclease McrA
MNDYLRYLESPEWWRQRQRALRRAGYVCERCESSEGLEVHHRLYHNLGDEDTDDLEVLCGTCHRNEHAPRNRALRVREQCGQERLFDRWDDPDIVLRPKKQAA